MRSLRWMLWGVIACATLLLARPVLAQEDAIPAGIVVRYPFASTAALDAIVARYDVWEVDHAAGYALVMLDPKVYHALKVEGTLLEIDAERTAWVETLPHAAGVDDTDSDWLSRYHPCYRTLDKSYTDLAALAQSAPKLARWVDIGDSWDKITAGGPAGSDLRALVLTNRDRPGPKFRYTIMAAIHARELTTAETAVRFAEALVQGYGVDPDATWLLDYGELHLIPFANPDGRRFAETGFLWRKNTHADRACGPPNPQFSTYGVDLNRNSSFGWNACGNERCSSSNTCSLTFRGLAAASEPETQAIERYLTRIYPDLRAPALDAAAPVTTTGLFISLHSYGEKVLFPWGFSAAPTPNADALRRLGERFALSTGYDACQTGEPGCLYSVDGATDDFAYGELGVASYTFEMGESFFEACATFEEIVAPDVTEALEVGFKAARLPYAIAGPEPITVTVVPTRAAAGEPISLTVTYAVPPALLAAPPAAGPVMTATYAITAPVWAGGEAVALEAADGSFDSRVETAVAVIDTTGWSLGRKTIFVDATGRDGSPGLTGAASVEIVFKQIIGPILPPPTILYLPGIVGP